MPLLERIVRPRETPHVHLPAISTLARVPDPPEDKVFTIGGGKGELFTMSGSYSENKSYTNVEVETRRRGDIMRVHNPEDEDQYLDVAVARSSETNDGESKYVWAPLNPQLGWEGGRIMTLRENVELYYRPRPNPFAG